MQQQQQQKQQQQQQREIQTGTYRYSSCYITVKYTFNNKRARAVSDSQYGRVFCTCRKTPTLLRPRSHIWDGTSSMLTEAVILCFLNFFFTNFRYRPALQCRMT